MDLPIDIIRELQATSIPITARVEDRLAWKFSTQGEFDLKSAYLLTLEPTVEVPFRRKWVWKLKTLPRIQAFVWRCMNQSIGVKQCLLARGIPTDPRCPCCHDEPETILHTLRDCPVSKNVWV